MPQKHIDVIRDQYTATNERDFDRAMAHYTADVELFVPPQYIRSGEFKGRDNVGAWFGDWLSSDRQRRVFITVDELRL
jgi:ketosteroid isomerase-like protein